MEQRFKLEKDSEWWFVSDNTIQVNEFGYRDDLTGEDKYRGLQQDLTEQEVVDKLNELYEENQSWLKTASHLNTIVHEDRDYAKRMHKENKKLKKENKELKSLCKVLIKHIEKESIAFVIDEDIRRLLE